MYESEPTRVQRGGKATNGITAWVATSSARTLQQVSVIFRCSCRILRTQDVAKS